MNNFIDKKNENDKINELENAMEKLTLLLNKLDTTNINILNISNDNNNNNVLADIKHSLNELSITLGNIYIIKLLLLFRYKLSLLYLY